MGQERTARRRAGLWALGGALAAHLALLALWTLHEPERAAPLTAGAEDSSSPSRSGASSEIQANALALVDVSALEMGEPAIGAADENRPLSDETATDAIDAPGAERGGASSGEPGRSSVSSRQDPALRSSTLWNDPQRNQMQEVSATGHRRRSPEALERAPEPGFSSRQRPSARGALGHAQDRSGLTGSQGAGGAPGEEGHEWLALDPRFDLAPSPQSKASGGVSDPGQSPLVHAGERATDVVANGRAQNTHQRPPRSSSVDPSPMGFSAPSAGGRTGLGAGGESRGHGKAGSGTAAIRGNGQGSELTATRARRDQPYFFRMYQRVDRASTFPKELELALEQGEVTLRVVLDPRGRIDSIRVQKSSGFDAFDEEAVKAFRKAAPFGAPPRSLMKERERLVVVAPYFFRNPLIR